ncbi:Ktr system potassium transporter B, partial [Vibrio parahaemolyticus]|nr:Ktr system potassium transporter B [Vibrio parahaemolyticus]
MSLRQQPLAIESLGQDRQVNLRRVVNKIVKFALVAESIVFVLVWYSWVPDMGWMSVLFFWL